MAEAYSCSVIWEELQPVDPKEVNMILVAVSSATCVLDSNPPWLFSISRNGVWLGASGG